MLISDWSSDVCSSDLGANNAPARSLHANARRARQPRVDDDIALCYRAFLRAAVFRADWAHFRHVGHAGFCTDGGLLLGGGTAEYVSGLCGVSDRIVDRFFVGWSHRALVFRLCGALCDRSRSVEHTSAIPSLM